MKWLRYSWMLAVLLCLPLSGNAAKKNNLDSSRLATLPMLHDGRIKPLSTVARHHYQLFSGNTAGAMDWMTQLLFNPNAAMAIPVFTIRNPEALTLLELPKRKPSRYSYKYLENGLKVTRALAIELSNLPVKQLSDGQRALLDVHEHANLYNQIARGVHLVLPLTVEIPENLDTSVLTNIGENLPDYVALMPLLPQLDTYFNNFIATQKPPAEGMAPVRLAMLTKAMEIGGLDSPLMRLIPPQWHGDTQWYTPWQTILEGKGTPQTLAYIRLWGDAARAWLAADHNAWRRATIGLHHTVHQLSSHHLNPIRLQAEHLYYKLQPFVWSSTLYIAATLLLLFSMRKQLASAMLIAGSLIDITGLAARIYILERPPVGTLYESVLFVAAMIAVLGAWRGRSNPALLLVGALGGALLHGVAAVFAPVGDTFTVLMAVLNTSFWLTTHVLTITTGYALCMLTALLAHGALWYPANSDKGQHLWQSMHRWSLMALFFTTFGTILGGIWADQSWGRFWGWDPKENGALLIILWLALLLHGLLGGQLSRRTVAAGMACLTIIVGIAWFGVNLLGVGLHSYGFTDQAAYGLFGFCFGQLLLIAGLVIRQRKIHAA